MLLLIVAIGSTVGLGMHAWDRILQLQPHLLSTIADGVLQGNYKNGFVYWIILMITFWILYSYLVPISLFVTLEIVKFWQGFLYINHDKEMKVGIQPMRPTPRYDQQHFERAATLCFAAVQMCCLCEGYALPRSEVRTLFAWH